MPRLPPAMPVSSDWVADWPSAGGASFAVSTRPIGAGCADATEPVTSPEALRDVKLSKKRVESALQPATPTAIPASTNARDCERSNSTAKDMVLLTHTQQRPTQGGELTPWR